MTCVFHPVRRSPVTHYGHVTRTCVFHPVRRSPVTHYGRAVRIIDGPARMELLCEWDHGIAKLAVTMNLPTWTLCMSSNRVDCMTCLVRSSRFGGG